MPLLRVPLVKLACLDASSMNKQMRILRKDAYSHSRRLQKQTPESGRNFYLCAWSDMKAYSLDGGCLIKATAQRLLAEPRRMRIYSRLRDGWLRFWPEFLRQHGEPIQRLEPMTGHWQMSAVGEVVIDNLLLFRGASGKVHALYPYWFVTPFLNAATARRALAVLEASLQDRGIDDLAIVDIARARVFAVSDARFSGDERAVLWTNYEGLVRTWRGMVNDYIDRAA